VAAACRRSEDGFSLTHRALAIIVAAFTIGAVLVGIGASKATAAAELKSKIDTVTYLHDQDELRRRLERDSTRIDALQSSQAEILERTRRTDERVGQMWCELHFNGHPPRSCQ
jgi:hypothetical protein